MNEPEISVLVPVYDEAGTVDELLRRVSAAPYRKQVIVVDDGSSDGTREILKQWNGRAGVEVHAHDRNRGKGAALRTALAHATAPYTIVQDADLEYDPADYPKLIEPLRRGQARVVYGTRYSGADNVLPWTKFRLGVHLLNAMVRVLYGARITDEATCYKAFETELLQSLNLRCERFEFCPEATAKVLKRGLRIVEVPIRFRYRTAAEGKKIGWRDGFEAIWTLLKYRFRD
ncbi:MAG: glycosyltransferase family 2 protein [Phycisphaerae bacterium]